LKRLALVTLAYAAKDNSGNIGGSFDLMTLGSDNQQFTHEHRLSLDEIYDTFHGKLKAAFDDLP
jgi:hypothetical protein